MAVSILAILVLGGLALILGAGLGFASVKLAVHEDEKVSLVRELLPGANCGGCGFIGCEDLAKAIVNRRAKPSSCPVATTTQADSISEIMGFTAEVLERKAAFIKCAGTDAVSKYNYRYEGLNNCMAAAQLNNGGSKACGYGCLGVGSCVDACKFGAIKIAYGIAIIENAKCTACGMCVKVCPKHLIEMVPYESNVRIACNSQDKAPIVRANCTVGCIGCKLCEKNCEPGAVTVTNFLAEINYVKCTMCGKCAEKCPTKAIRPACATLSEFLEKGI